MIRLNKTDNKRKLEIKAEISRSTDHNLPKVPCSRGGNFMLALSEGSKKFSNSSLKKIVCYEREDISE